VSWLAVTRGWAPPNTPEGVGDGRTTCAGSRRQWCHWSSLRGHAAHIGREEIAHEVGCDVFQSVSIPLWDRLADENRKTRTSPLKELSAEFVRDGMLFNEALEEKVAERLEDSVRVP